MSIAIIVQARMGSERLPKKVLRDLCGKPMLEHILNRILRATAYDNLVVATTELCEDSTIAEACNAMGVDHFRGSALDVLDRYYQCAKKYNAKTIVRLTADNPFVDPSVIDDAINAFMEDNDIDYMYYIKGLPLGVCVEVFTFEALELAWEESTSEEYREHVTPYIYLSGKCLCSFPQLENDDFSSVRLTVDTPEDFITAEAIYRAFDCREDVFGYREVVDYLAMHPEIIRNHNVVQRQLSSTE